MAILKPGQLASGSYTISGSFSGSFQGSGAGLNNIPSSAIVGLSSTQIASGAVSASVSTGTGSFTVNSGSSTFMFISSSGNVGFGTSTPNARLTISGSTSVGVGITLEDLGTNKGSFSAVNGGTYVQGFNNGLFLGTIATPDTIKLVWNGNVLIGTTTDAGYKLDVNGIFGLGTAGGRLYSTGGNGLQANFGNAQFSLGPESIDLSANSGGDIRFSTANVSNRLVIKNNGNVLIGTGTDAGFKLDVSGSARIQDNVIVSKNQNATTTLSVLNTDTTNASSRARILVANGTITGSITAITSNDVYIGAESAHNLNLMTAGTVRANINNTSANLSIGVLASDMGARLGVKGSGTTSSTIAFLIQNSAGTNSLQILDNGTLRTNSIANLDGTGLVKIPQYLVAQADPFVFKNTGNVDMLYMSTTVSSFQTPISVGLGFGVSPSARAHIRGTGITSATTTLLVQNSNASASLAVLDNGNVGIGTPSPSASLHISGSSGSALFEIDSPAVNNILFVSGSGRVGIGTGTPTETLDVNGTARVQGNATIGINSNTALITSVRNSNSGSSSSTEIAIGNDSSAFIGSLATFSSTFSTPFVRNSICLVSYAYDVLIGTNLNVASGGANVIKFATGGSNAAQERMRIFSTGNIGINTTTDDGFRLDVNGTARVQGASYFGTTSGNVGIGTTDAATPFGTAKGLVINAGSGNDAQVRLQNNAVGATASDGGLLSISNTLMYLWNYEAGPLIFGTGNAERLRIFSTGNVGINTTTDAGFRLDVNGTARVQGALSSTSTITAQFGFVQIGSNANTFAGLINHMGASQQVLGLNTTRINAQTDLSVGYAGAPDASAVIQANSTTKGFLPPRMTGAQAEAISSPAEGLMVYATSGTGVTITSKGWWGYDGATWVKLN